MPIVSIADLIEFRLLRDSLVEQIACEEILTPAGTFEARCFKSHVDGAQHVALVKGGPFNADQVVDVRVHRQRPLMDVVNGGHFGRGLIDYGLQLLSQSDHAVVLYLSHPAGSRAFVDDVIEMGQATASAGTNPSVQPPLPANWRAMDPRLYGIGAQILRNLGVRRMKTHVSTPRSLKGLSGFGLEIVDIAVISS